MFWEKVVCFILIIILFNPLFFSYIIPGTPSQVGLQGLLSSACISQRSPSDGSKTNPFFPWDKGGCIRRPLVLELCGLQRSPRGLSCLITSIMLHCNFQHCTATSSLIHVTAAASFTMNFKSVPTLDLWFFVQETPLKTEYFHLKSARACWAVRTVAGLSSRAHIELEDFGAKTIFCSLTMSTDFNRDGDC